MLRYHFGRSDMHKTMISVDEALYYGPIYFKARNSYLRLRSALEPLSIMQTETTKKLITDE